MKNSSDAENKLPEQPAQTIEQPEKHLGLRIAAFVVLLVIGIGSLIYAFVAFLNRGTGWRTVETGLIRGYSYDGEIVFDYYSSSISESKNVSVLYKSLLERVCPLFESDIEYEGINNIRYINSHINEQIVVDELLYSAFEKISENGFRIVYAAPYYEEYRSIFFCIGDYDAAEYDQRKNAYIAERAARISAYAADPQSVDLKLLGNNTVMLYVSDEYKAYADSIGSSTYIDLWLIKNAFIIDYCANTMIKGGYTHGRFSTYDGYLRNLDEGTDYLLQLSEPYGTVASPTGGFAYNGVITAVCMRDFVLTSLDESRVFTYSDGQRRTWYLSEDGLYDRTFCPSMTVYSYSGDCADIAIPALKAYIRSEDDPAFPDKSGGVFSIYSKNETVYYNEAGLALSNTLKTPVYFEQ